MRKKLKNLFFGVLLCVLLVCPIDGNAAELETGRSCSLTLDYSANGKGFEGLEIRIYRVAEAFSDGTFELITPYAGYPVKIHGITSQKEWKDAAHTLNSYLHADHLKADRTEKTDAKGKAVFGELKTGLYLIDGVTAKNSKGIYTFESFLVYLPTPLEGGSFNYQVNAKPKYRFEEKETERTASVLKLWKDNGKESQRPDSVEVNILKDGSIWKSVILNEDNHWTYSWKIPAGSGQWSVVEKNVPKGYTVAVSSNGTSFVIVNTKAEEKTGGTSGTELPKTGDTAPIWLYIAALSASGMLLLLLGAFSLRGEKHEKKK